MGLPFFSGFTTFFILLAITIVLLVRWAAKKGHYFLKLGLWCAGFMLLGYSTYFTTLIRSNADTAVDMYERHPLLLRRQQHLSALVCTGGGRHPSRVRVMVNTLTGSDWYINQLRNKINNSAPFDLLFTPEQVMGEKKSVVYFIDNPGYDKNRYYDLYDTFRTVLANDDPRYMVQSDNGTPLNTLPTRKFSVPVDAGRVVANGTAHRDDAVVPQLNVDISTGKRYLLKNELTMLSVIAANKWQRPICFTSTNELDALGLTRYARSRDMAYQLVPVADERVDNSIAYNTVMQKFRYGNAARPGVYFDEENRKVPATANGLLSVAGRRTADDGRGAGDQRPGGPAGQRQQPQRPAAEFCHGYPVVV